MSDLKIPKFFLVLLFSLFPVFAFPDVGLGAAASCSLSQDSHFFCSFTAKSDESPWCVFFNAHPNDNTITVFADDWFINERIAEHLDYYVLWGVSGGFRFDDNLFELGTGCRFGSGLDFFFFRRHLEIFAQAVWNPYFCIKKEDGDCSPVFKPVNFPVSAGLRVWF